MDQQYMIENDGQSKIEEQEHSFQAQNDGFEEDTGKPQVMRQNLIDDEDLANALPQQHDQQDSDGKVLSLPKNDRHQMRFEANKYGSFAANENEAGDADDEAFAANSDDNEPLVAHLGEQIHSRVVSQRVEHEDDVDD